jgi:AcrR family transcriptional regulator
MAGKQSKTPSMARKQNPLGHQAQKAQRTRDSLIDATIALIREGGFSAASSTRIAERAGITWGAAQHHFGTKEDILDAILALSYERYVTSMAAPSLREGSLEERVGKFVDRMWAHYQTDVYLVALEILLATRAERHKLRAWEERQGATHLAVVREIFADTRLSTAKVKEALNYVHFLMTGISIEGAFEEDVRDVGKHIQRLKATLLLALSGKL